MASGWLNRLYLGDNLRIMGHLLGEFRGQVDFAYLDPPFASNADYKKRVSLKGGRSHASFEAMQYSDIWSEGEYLQFIYERLIALRELLSPKGSVCLHCDPGKGHLLRCVLDEVFGAANFRNEIVWHYTGGGRSKTNFSRKHDLLLLYAKNKKRIFNADAIRLPYKKSSGYFRGGIVAKSGKKYLPNPLGTLPDDVWDIPIINPLARERLDYPTQKPEALLERLLKALSNPDSLVLDCFMGSCTSLSCAMKLGRRFIGADCNPGALETGIRRLAALLPEKGAACAMPYANFGVYKLENPDAPDEAAGEASVAIEDGKLLIRRFSPRNLLQKLAEAGIDVEDWPELVESVAIDHDYDGHVFRPYLLDAPGKNEQVKKEYRLPERHGAVRIKITDLLSRSLELTVANEEFSHAG